MIDEIGYENLIEQAMLDVVKSVLKKVEKEGLQGEHHFFISFLTHHLTVKIPTFLLKKHAEEMTIVLQNQFWNLTVDDKGFFVELSFNQVREKLYVPFNALLSFSDPSVQFSLHFKTPFKGDKRSTEPPLPKTSLDQKRKATEILDFSQFKKKHTHATQNKDSKDD